MAVLPPRRETARLRPPNCFAERLGHRAIQTRLASPFPPVSLEHPEGFLVGRCHGAIGSLLLRPSKWLAPPLADRPRCPSASGRRDLYTRACPRGSRPPQESGMTTAPNWAIVPAGPPPARTDSGTGCTWSLTSWVAALSAAPSRTRLFSGR